MFVKYFIPEDGDEERYPNIFKIDETNRSSTTLDKIKKQFPLQGVFVFRFLRNLNGNLVWLDAGSGGYDDSQVTIPVDPNDGLLMKVTRVQNSSSGSGGQSQVQVNTTRTTSTDSNKSPFGLSSMNEPASRSEPAQSSKPAQRRGSETLMKFEEEVASPLVAGASESSTSADLFGFDPFSASDSGPSASGPSSASAADNIFRDFDNMTPPPTAVTPPTVDPFATSGSGATMNSGMSSKNNSNNGLNNMGGLNLNPMQGGMGTPMQQHNPMGGGMGAMNNMGGRGGGINNSMGGGMNRNGSGGRNMGGDAFSSLGTMGNNNGARKW